MTTNELYEVTKYIQKTGKRGLHSWVNKNAREIGYSKNPNGFQDLKDDILIGMDGLEEQGRLTECVCTLNHLLEIIEMRSRKG
jgi:hypothetical protein